LYAGIEWQAMSAEFPETSRYTRVGRSVPSLPALSWDLVDATAEWFGLQRDGTLEFDIVGQANHAVCAVAVDSWAAYEHIERLDHSEILLKSGVAARASKQRTLSLAA